MFCTNCGNEIDNDAVFCPVCGANTAQQGAQVQQPGMNQAAQPAAGAYAAQPAKPKKPVNKKLAGIIAGAAALVVVLAVIIATRKPTVKLNQYIEVEFDGYDTLGRASYTFDRDAFERDYAGKLKLKAGNKQANSYANYFMGMMEVDASTLLYETCVSGSLDTRDGLSNGDEVIFTWDCDDDTALQGFGCKLKYSDITFTVEGLEEIKTFDPFADLDVSFYGIAPNGSISAENNATDDASRALSFWSETQNNLSNGDTVVVEVSNFYGDSDITRFIEKYGKMPSPLSKEYTVSGLQSYAEHYEDIPEETIAAMQAQAEDILKARFAQGWDSDRSKLENLEPVGVYFQTLKSAEDTYWLDRNRVFCVYALQPEVWTDDGTFRTTITYYSYVGFHSIVTDDAGNGEVNLADYYICGEDYHFDPGVKDDGWSTSWYFDGLETVEEIEAQLITKNLDVYSYENHIDESKVLALAAGAATASAEAADEKEAETEADAGAEATAEATDEDNV